VSGIHLLPYHPNDREALADLVAGFAAAMASHSDLAMSAEEYLRAAERPEACCLTAWRVGELVGYGVAFPAFGGGRPAWVIEQLFSTHTWAGRKLGRALEAEGARQGFAYAVADVAMAHVAMQRGLRWAGYQPVAVLYGKPINVGGQGG